MKNEPLTSLHSPMLKSVFQKVKGMRTGCACLLVEMVIAVMSLLLACGNWPPVMPCSHFHVFHHVFHKEARNVAEPLGLHEAHASPTVQFMRVDMLQSLALGLGTELRHIGGVESAHVDARPVLHARHVALQVVQQDA